MATISKRGKRWQAQVYVRGTRRAQSFDSRSEAMAWAVRVEAELAGGRDAVRGKTLRDAAESYLLSVAPRHRGERWERLRLALLLRTWSRADALLADLTDLDFAALRDARAAVVSAGTVLREMGLARAVLEHARLDLRWISVNPMSDVRMPPQPPARRRRVGDDEIEAMLSALGYRRGDAPVLLRQQVAIAFLLALETAMRSGEILSLRWGDVREKSVTIQQTKNGDARDVPLSPAARDLLALMPRAGPLVFGVKPGSRDALWRKARVAAMRECASVATLHFHDSRAEAIWRLSKKLGVLDLARVIGHRDPRSLMLYYNASADELADAL